MVISTLLRGNYIVLNFIPVTLPANLSLKDLYYDPSITPQDRVKIMDPGKYEEMTEVWLSDCKKDIYEKVLKNAGANDGGRDIVCFYNNETSMDIYQCKHYESQISYSIIAQELLKVCYHVFKGNYISPQKYYIVSPKGCSNIFRTSFLEGNNYTEFNNALFKTMSTNNYKFCNEYIKQLKGFEKFITDFDFSIVEEITPQKFIDEFSVSKYAHYYLGTSFVKFNREDAIVPSVIENRENIYVQELCKVYSELDNVKYVRPNEIDDRYLEHFQIQRTYFYSIEAYRNMIRDNLPSFKPIYDIEELIHKGISDIVTDPFRNGYKKLSDSLERSVTMNLDSYPLRTILTPHDKKGMCHRLVNEGKIKWIK